MRTSRGNLVSREIAAKPGRSKEGLRGSSGRGRKIQISFPFSSLFLLPEFLAPTRGITNPSNDTSAKNIADKLSNAIPRSLRGRFDVDESSAGVIFRLITGPMDLLLSPKYLLHDT